MIRFGHQLLAGGSSAKQMQSPWIIPPAGRSRQLTNPARWVIEPVSLNASKRDRRKAAAAISKFSSGTVIAGST
ncbi:hypothetical protein [Rhodopila sp.]|uniref:hypothetical protein n=1 Tax=Rhodopila sp. TaxID=2480087 RepID=UPI003D0B11C4